MPSMSLTRPRSQACLRAFLRAGGRDGAGSSISPNRFSPGRWPFPAPLGTGPASGRFHTAIPRGVGTQRTGTVTSARAPRSEAHLSDIRLASDDHHSYVKDRPSAVSPSSACSHAHDESCALRSGPAETSTRSAFTVSHRPDGFRHHLAAGMLQPANDPGVRRVSVLQRRVPATPDDLLADAATLQSSSPHAAASFRSRAPSPFAVPWEWRDLEALIRGRVLRLHPRCR